MKRTVSAIALLFLAASCAKVSVFVHDEHKANAVASEFLGGLSTHKYEASYRLLHPTVQNQLPYQQFVSMAQSQEEQLGKIEAAIWDAFYPQPGQPLIGFHYAVRYSVAGEADYYLLLRLDSDKYLIQYFVNGPKGEVNPQMVMQLKQSVEPQKVL